MSDHHGFAGLARWLIAHRFETIPADALAAGKQCVLDGLACLRAGLDTVQLRAMLRALALNSVAAEGAIPLGRGLHGGLLDAAHAYAQAANVLDFDDCYREEAPSHPGATIIGPALACAHRSSKSGRDLLHAIVVAYEASLRIGTMLCPSEAAPSKDIGYATWQTFGAFIAAGMLLELDETQWRHGFGLTAQQAPMPTIVRANPQGGYTWLKNGYGNAASIGVLSACLAKEGYAGDQHFFSDEFGFWKTYGSDRIRPACLDTLPGDDWLIRRIEFKPWACCRWAHPALEGVLQMKLRFPLEQIDAIDLYSFREFVDTLDSPFPANLIDAQFNARFLIASAFVADDLNDALREPDFASPAIRALFAKIHVHHEPAFDRQHRADMSIPTRVVLRLADGSRHETLLAEPLGSHRREPMSPDATRAKFAAALRPVIGAVPTERALATILELEAHSARDLMQALFPSV
ncbi:MmgE/PrpD family protein [Paraburkholderia silvatlantica]|uniref:2-methylcitrate dehydratase PrpD n=1 Tax=Paraburkholderia silvatlantica TaxID=321895 RepID=A0ABR6FFY9_9BURK|nr:MmgE/PrpD family protein [Paraburkholderia silvatlantica]MBB2925740.1 2-methylcitrate dehydratase PrpD [Paraburkholderia silvatlantica]PVY33144.1 2-methylcitrate dehydratase PrpD [Paraburkholderia silvatlantica]PXW38036.1 2-methylcitrate dehydratase PrpD [Paraburkholderia silvatlantica]TDQ92565.1 2-methylcitrate dehydratase PrpD [Paraburkholderia silvatlantica]